MAYNELRKISSIKYVKAHQKQVVIRYKNDVWNNEILPVIEKTGLCPGTFIKQAVQEKIARMADES